MTKSQNKLVRLLFLMIVISFISYAIAEENSQKHGLIDNVKYYFKPQYINYQKVTKDNILLNYRQHLTQATEYLHKKNWEKCAVECDFILREFPKNPDALRIKGDIYFYKNLYSQAIWYYQQSIDTYETPETWISLARVYDTLQMYKESAYSWEKALAKHILSGDERIIRYELGLVYLKLNQKEKAGEQFRKCLDISPDSPKDIYDVSKNIDEQLLAKQIEVTNKRNNKYFSK